MLPVRPLVMPSTLNGQTNGRLDPSVLSNLGGLLMEHTAATAFVAMMKAAAMSGVWLRPEYGYRDYATQEQLFRDRYTTTPMPGRPSSQWQGQTWWLLPGQALAAVPGTSNHGWGLAVDLSTAGDFYAVQLPWLVANAPLWGFSAEVQSEPWHWRYFPGDLEEDDMAMSDDDMRRLAGFIAEALDARARTVHSYRDGGDYRTTARTLEEWTFAEGQQATIAAQGLSPK